MASNDPGSATTLPNDPDDHAGGVIPGLEEPDPTAATIEVDPLSAAIGQVSLAAYMSRWAKGVRSGNSSVLPVLGGLVVIVLIFQLQKSQNRENWSRRVGARRSAPRALSDGLEGSRIGKLVEVVRVCAYSRPDSLDWTGWVEVKRTDGTHVLIRTIERPLPRNGGKVRFVVCPLCQKPRRGLYGGRVNRTRTNSVLLTSWECRECIGLRYASEGVVHFACGPLPLCSKGSFLLSEKTPRVQSCWPYVFANPLDVKSKLGRKKEVTGMKMFEVQCRFQDRNEKQVESTVKLEASSLPGAVANASRQFVEGLDRKQRFGMNKDGLEIKAKSSGLEPRSLHKNRRKPPLAENSPGPSRYFFCGASRVSDWTIQFKHVRPSPGASHSDTRRIKNEDTWPLQSVIDYNHKSARNPRSSNTMLSRR